MPFTNVEPPARTIHRYGIFSVATVIDEPAENMGGSRWLPHPCENPGSHPDPCLGSSGGEDDGEKSPLDQPRVNESTPFTVYGSFSCPPLGFSMQEATNRAVQSLEIGEQHTVENTVWTGELGNEPSFVSPESVNLGEASCWQEVLDTIYAHADIEFAGEPVIHVPRPAVSWFRELVRQSGRLETVQGTPVVSGSGYTEANLGPDGESAPEGSWWIYVTGPLVVRRSPIRTVPDPASQGFNTRNNDFLVLAERVYSVGWDCLTAGVLFTPAC